VVFIKRVKRRSKIGIGRLLRFTFTSDVKIICNTLLTSVNVPSRHLYAIQMPTVPTIQLGHSPAVVEQAIQETEEQANLDVLVFHHNDRIDLCQF